MALSPEIFGVDVNYSCDISVCLSSLHTDAEVRDHFGFRMSMKPHMHDDSYLTPSIPSDPLLGRLCDMPSSCYGGFVVISTRGPQTSGSFWVPALPSHAAAVWNLPA